MSTILRRYLPTPINEDGSKQAPIDLPQLLGRFTDMAANIDILRRLGEVEQEEKYARIIDDIREVEAISTRKIVRLTPVAEGDIALIDRVVIALPVGFERGGNSRSQANIYFGNVDPINFIGIATGFFGQNSEGNLPGVTFEPYSPIVLSGGNESLSIQIAPARVEPYVPVIAYGRIIKQPPAIIER